MSDSDSDAFQSADEGDEEESVVPSPEVRTNDSQIAPPVEPKPADESGEPVKSEKPVKSVREEKDEKPLPKETDRNVPSVVPKSAEKLPEPTASEKPVKSVQEPVKEENDSVKEERRSPDPVPTTEVKSEPTVEKPLQRVPKVSKLGLKKPSASSKNASIRSKSSKLGAQRIAADEVVPVVDSFGELSLEDEQQREAGAEELVEKKFRERPEKPSFPSASPFVHESPKVTNHDDWSSPHESSDSWGSWTSWGTSVVSTFTHQVATGITTVKEVVESGLGIPDPEELARSHAEAKRTGRSQEEEPSADSVTKDGSDEVKKEVKEEPKIFSLFGGAFTAGSHIISGGLGTLEYIGKKTVEVLQENDPGLRRKRDLLQGKQPTLSDMLNEARKISEMPPSSQNVTKSYEERNTVTAVFEELGGLTHFEALSSLKDTLELKCLTGADGDGRLKMLFEKYSFGRESFDEDFSEEADEEKADLKDLVESMANFLQMMDFRGVNGAKVLAIQDQIKNLDPSVAVDSVRFESYMRRLLASLAAAHVEILHRIAEGLLVLDGSSDSRGPRSLLPTVFQLAKCFVNQYEAIAAELSNGLKDKNEGGLEPSAVSRLVKETYQEAMSLTSWVREAYELVKAVMRILAANDGKLH